MSALLSRGPVEIMRRTRETTAEHPAEMRRVAEAAFDRDRGEGLIGVVDKVTR